ncbi:MAG: phage portal protein [Firmicutes bacterium]|nr:phage portal protein [Bacillota bacterium]
MAKKGWLMRAIGEISKLRQPLGLFGQVIWGRWNVPYVLGSSRVDYVLARQLYHNTHDDYKLGAGFAKPIVNTLAGFMGVPRFYCEDEEAQAVLKKHAARWVSRMQRTHQLCLRDGDCFVMLANLAVDDPLYPEDDTRIEYVIIPPEQVVDIEVDPLTRKPVAYTIQARNKWDSGRREYAVTQRIAVDKVTVAVEGDAPPGLVSEERPNPWGFIPIVHFKNEPEETELYGTSELEAVEPYLKAYHDVMLHAIQGSKMHSTPRLKLKLGDVERFILNNFGQQVLDKIRRGEQASVNLQGHELLIFADGEDASFIEVRSAIGDAEALLKLLFYCIVDVSEVPEFAFGVHTPSSHASVKEQMPLLIRRVARKREMVTENWQLLGRMLLVMCSKITGKKFASYDVEITWDAVVERDEKEYADTLKTVVDALSTALQNGIISMDAAVDLLKQYVETMRDYVTDDPELPGERERIIKSWIMRRRLEDGEVLEEQKRALEEELGNE